VINTVSSGSSAALACDSNPLGRIKSKPMFDPNFTMEVTTMKISGKSVLSILVLCGMVVAMTQAVHAHCQIPCGIYDDHARVHAMLEDAATVEKSIKLITDLSGKDDPQSQNQLIRWVMNKEKHAQNIITTISDYFLTQRVKPSQKDYSERLTRHHAVILAAMKVKQHADISYAQDLRASIETLLVYYPQDK
jgi:nickel superoxide dismutase